MLIKLWQLWSISLWIGYCRSANEPPSSQGWPRNKNVAASRESPIDLKTKLAVFAPTKPLIQKIFLDEKIVLINTGTALEVRIDQKTEAHLVGGVLYDDCYVFNSIRFFWTENTTKTDVAENSVNGIGTPLAAEIYYYNKKYGNFNNSLYHNDGLAIISFLISVGSVSNPAFKNFQTLTNKVIRPESRITIPIRDTITWFDYLTVSRNYYAYPGMYSDVLTGKPYKCATIILLPQTTASPFISKKQFENSFRRLKGIFSNELLNYGLRQPIAGRPISCSDGIQIINAE